MQGVIILFVTLLVWGSSYSWAACGNVQTTTSWYNSQCSATHQYYVDNSNTYSCTNTHAFSFGSCNRTLSYTIYSSQPIVCVGTYSSGWDIIAQYQRCGSQCDADSLVCVTDGGTWAENPNAACGKSCTINGCTAADTANINALKARCDSLGGTNNFALVNNGTEGCGLSGFCDLCNGTAYQKIRKDQQKNCCEQGHAPDTSALKCSVESITSTDKTFNVSGANRCLSGDPQIIITPTGESYREGCDDPPPPTNSSNSGGSSSSESGLSSSSETGLSSGGLGDLDWLKDSTHKIIRYDSTTAANSIDLVNYLYDIKTCLEAGTCGGSSPNDYTGTINEVRDTLHHSNELLKQIADKDLSVQVNGGLTAEKQAELVSNIGKVADSTAKYGVLNGERLDSIISALKGIGADSVAHRLDSVRNEYMREGIDSIYSLHRGLDSTFADWSDTSGAAAGGDTTGKGGELDALGDSLENALWSYPCDTTGGKSCNTAYIGADGIANARSGWKGAADALGDSLNGGAVKDSVNAWTNKIVNNGVLSGNGAATCPAVFNRTWQVPIGTGITYTFGPFGKIVCYDFFGGITFWALARIVLRAMVAITCMWWLYHAVTGTTARGDDDED